MSQDLFSDPPSNAITAPKYAAIHEAERLIREALADTDALTHVTGASQDVYRIINDACRAFHDVILRECPPSADTTTAARNIRLVRMMANEDVKTGNRTGLDSLITTARLWACAAIALNTPEVTP